MDAGRRAWLGALAVAPLFVRHARAADVPRFALGVASGQAHAQGMVLWTRLTGAALPPAVDVDWELADDEAFTKLVARGTETAREADAHSVHAEPAGLRPERWYWYRFGALGQRSAVGRTRTAPAPDAVVSTLNFMIASCQRYDVGHYAAWRHAAADAPDLVMFLGDYIYEYGSSPLAVRRHTGGRVKLLADYRDRHALYKSDPDLQAAHAVAPWLLVCDDHEVENDYAGLQGERLQSDFAQQRADAYQAYWEHMPLPKAARPVDGAMRMHGRLDWGRLARIHLLDSRQMRDPQACPKPGWGGSNTVDLSRCAELANPRRTLLGADQERWLAEGWSLERPWNLLAQQTLMANWSWADPARGGRYGTDGWNGYPAARRRLLQTVADRQVPGVVVLGGDVHANYVADLKPDFDDAKAPIVASEFCGTSISSLGRPQRALSAAHAFNRGHVHHARSDERGYVRFRLDAQHLRAELQVLDDARRADSAITTSARFTVEAARAGVLRG